MNAKINVANRNSDGVVTVSTDSGIITAKIPPTHSMISIIGTNGIISNGNYSNDGWVYINNKPIKKWHTRFDNIRLWEPKLNDLPSLYKLYKKTQAASNNAWNEIEHILKQIWKCGPRKHNEVIAHAIPTHDFTCKKQETPWWTYNIGFDPTNKTYSFYFNWTEGNPKKVINHKLGQKLYEREQYWLYAACSRERKAKTIFFEAMKRSLPTPVINNVIALQFENDVFWFHTVSVRHVVYWELFDFSNQVQIHHIL